MADRSAGPDPADLAAAAAYDERFAAFVEDLNRLHIEHGAPSYGEICGAADVFKLTKAGLADLLTGKRLPAMNFLLEFVRVVSNPLPVDGRKPRGHKAHPELIDHWRRRWVDLRTLNRQLQSPLGRVRNATKLLVETAERTAEEAVGAAEEHARQLRSRAEAEAAFVLEEARQQAARLVGEAAERAEAVRAEAERVREEAEGVRRSACADAQEIVEEGRRLSFRTTSGALRELRETVEKISESQLPELIERITSGRVPENGHDLRLPSVGIHGRDSVGRLARCFESVMRLAVEQALLRGSSESVLANLSRRGQRLIQRQLGLLAELERRETDPERLADLFKLDHLAARVRRNGENLLVLTGEDRGGRWTRPVPLVDVLGAAASEVEHHERIELLAVPSAEVAGRVVDDLVHLLVELLENATSFSRPQSFVPVVAHVLPDGRVLVEIHDTGIGFSPDDLGEINERLANPPIVDASVSRRMGLFVVGRLALRHGIRVQLRPRSDGTTALVMIPVDLLKLPAAEPLVDGAAPPAGRPPDVEGAGARRAGKP
ncbi:ATP-binding protein [Kitasatospora sp. NPDC059648]|uniref:ATP-binding protein n=1 Tax=Kitasatospora sp. NPDC059648 TaxID=3346894 RepID=UPI00369644EB